MLLIIDGMKLCYQNSRRVYAWRVSNAYFLFTVIEVTPAVQRILATGISRMKIIKRVLTERLLGIENEEHWIQMAQK
jgi:hypothetical protein